MARLHSLVGVLNVIWTILTASRSQGFLRRFLPQPPQVSRRLAGSML